MGNKQVVLITVVVGCILLTIVLIFNSLRSNRSQQVQEIEDKYQSKQQFLP